VGNGSTIGAGSTITKDVPGGALAISRVRQKNISGWGKKIAYRLKKKNNNKNKNNKNED
jgi:bifunctional UDP-N-acetylglucosamine pyrophosphorylase/glucosamine-1-phosphate N-acetyltransferase